MPKVSVGRAELDTRPHILYRFYDRTGVLLYVGITVDFAEREKQHAKSKEWWDRVDRSATTVEYHLGRRAVLDAERLAIKAERPLENDQHNEWVEVDDAEEGADEAHELAREVLGDLDPDHREKLLKNWEVDWDDTPLTERQRDIRAAGSAVFEVEMRYRNLAECVDELLDLLPHGRGEQFRAFTRSGTTTTSNDDRFDDSYQLRTVIPGAAKSWVLQAAIDVLEALPADEANEWMRNISEDATAIPGRRTILAARYASIWKQYRMFFAGHCLGPGTSGARCATRVDVLTFFELCVVCEPGTKACSGHDRWCKEHAEAALQGNLSMLADDPFADVIRPIYKIEALPEISAPVF